MTAVVRARASQNIFPHITYIYTRSTRHLMCVCVCVYLFYLFLFCLSSFYQISRGVFTQ